MVWQVPESVCRVYAAGGVTSMYDWQVDCLRVKEVLEGTRNLVYSAPTSGGKTLGTSPRLADLVVPVAVANFPLAFCVQWPRC